MATLLTGTGYIGAALLRQLVDRGADRAPIVALDNFFSTSRGQIEAALPAESVQLIEGDVANENDVARAFNALPPRDDVTVYHLAAQPSAAIAAQDPEVTERTNLVGARVVLQAASDRRARVVFGGSFRTYGDDLVGQIVDEQTPYGRVSDLSHLSKLYVEQLARMMDVAFVSVRLGVTYGLSPIMKTTRALMTVPNLFCQRAANGEPLQVVEDRPVAFIHVLDAAAALILAADRQASTGPTWEVVNAASEVATIGHVARAVRRQAQERGLSPGIAGPTSSQATFGIRSRLDKNGFRPEHRLDGSLGDVLDFFLERR